MVPKEEELLEAPLTTSTATNKQKIKAINDISLNYFNREVNEKKLFF
jgi:hypothetical protein